MKRVAFFDIDGTIFRSSLLIELVEALVTSKLFPPETIHEYQKQYAAWRNREGTYEAYIGAVIAAFLKHIKGVEYGAFADVGRQVVETQGKHVYRYSRDLVQDLKRQGYMVIAISQSPKTILDAFCKEYGFDKVYGRMYEIGPTDKFTGKTIDEHLIENKANIVNRVFQNDPTLNRAESVAVGDTEGDVPLLESVDQAICFNPNRALYDHALTVGWEVVVERKDVIYHL